VRPDHADDGSAGSGRAISVSRSSSSFSQISLRVGKAGTASHSSSIGVSATIAIVAACSQSATSLPVNVAPTITPAYDDDSGVYAGAFGSDRLDASVLLMPMMGLVAAEDERMRATIHAIGPTGKCNPQRQGLNSALLDKLDPLHVIGGIPTLALDYSPLWDINLGRWTPDAVRRGYRSRLIDEFQLLEFVRRGFITGPAGARYGSVGIRVNCPIVHRFL